nr:hypothetical protein [Tanacetum cinerariifolium]
MAISTISISSDSFEESVGTPSGRVLWSDTYHLTYYIHNAIYCSYYNYTSPFIYTNSFNDDTLDTPPSPTHEIPPVEVAPPTSQILPAPFGVSHRRVTIVSPGQPIPYGRLYRYHLNGQVHIMTVRKRVGPLPTHRLAMRYSVDYSLSDYFTSDDSPRDSPSDSSSETSSDFFQMPYPILHLVIHLRIIHHQHYHQRSMSPTTSVPISLLVPGALSSARDDLLPPRKRIMSFNSAAYLEDCSDESSDLFVPRETCLRDDVVVRGSDEPYSEPDIDPKIHARIDECIAYADALRVEWIDARVVVETVVREEVEMSARGTVEVRVDRVTHHVVSDDILEPAQEERAIKGIYETLGDLGHMIVATGQQSAIQSERISELERDNTRLKACWMLRVRELPDFCTMPNTRSGVTMTRKAVDNLIARRVAEALEARDVAKSLKPLAEGGDEQEGENGDDYKGRNGGGDENGNGNRMNGNGNERGNDNGNGNGNERRNSYENHNVNFEGFIPVARECTYQDFLKCQPLNFKGTEEVIGLTRWFKKMETMFHISNYPQKNQKMKTELCNMTMKGNDLTAYTRRFQELHMLCTRMVLDEDKVERFIGGLPDNIQENVIDAEPTRLQEAIRIANNFFRSETEGLC